MTDQAPRSRTPRLGLAINWIDLGMLTVAFIWGVNFTIVKQTLREMSPMAFVAVRFVLASLFITLALVLSGENLRIHPKDLWKIAVLGLIGNTAYQIFFIQGLARTTASNSSLLLATTPIFVTVFALLLRTEPITTPMGAGVLLSFLGTSLIIGLGQGGLSFATRTLTGDMLTLGATLCWSVYTLLSKPLLRRYSAMKLVGVAMIAGTPPLVLASADELVRQDWGGISLQGWLGLGYAFLFANVVAYIIWNASVHRSGNARTAVFSNVTPIIAVTVSWLFLGETLGVWQGVGAVVTLTGVTLTRLSQRKGAEPT